MIHVPRVELADRGTAERMNPIATLAGLARHALKAPFTIAGTAVRLVRSAAGATGATGATGTASAGTGHARDHRPASPEPEVEITPDQPINVTEELGLDPSPVAKPKRPRKQPEKPVTAIDAQADPSEVDVTPADVAEAVSHRAPRPTDG